MRKGVDCKGKEWEEIELPKSMINAAGERFVRLRLQFPVKCNGKKQWLCLCDCGNELVAAYNCLSNDNTKSCGCLHRDKMKNRWNQYREENNVIGQVFGELTVVKFLRVENEQAIYLFQCSCGERVELPIVRVKNGNTNSCGHLWTDWNDSTKSDIIAKRFGRLVARSYVGIDKYGSTLFECECDCGNTTILPRYSLVNDRTHSCGCIVSVGESNIKKILDDKNIKYKSQQTFPDLKSNVGKELQYDFGLLDNNGQVIRLIEFDGQQHDQPIKYFGGEEKFVQQKYHDLLKNQYALVHNIPLVRIPYIKRDTMSLEDLLGDKYLIKGGE